MKTKLDETLMQNQNLFKSVDRLGLPIRLSNLLKAHNIIYIGDLIQRTQIELIALPSLGSTSLDHITKALELTGLSLGTVLMPGKRINISDHLVIDRSLPADFYAEQKAERAEFNDWFYQDFCSQVVAPLHDVNKKEIFDAIYSIKANQDARDREFKIWQAANRLSKAKHAAAPNPTLMDLDDIDNSTLLQIAKAFYRRALVVDGLTSPVNLDEENPQHDLQLIAHMRTALMWLDINAGKVEQLQAQPLHELDGVIDINVYLKQYQDGDVIVISDRNKFSTHTKSGVRVHFINYKTMRSFSSLAPYKRLINQVHEIFIDKGLIVEDGKKAVNDYVHFIASEFQCLDTAKLTQIKALNFGIYVELSQEG